MLRKPTATSRRPAGSPLRPADDNRRSYTGSAAARDSPAQSFTVGNQRTGCRRTSSALRTPALRDGCGTGHNHIAHLHIDDVANDELVQFRFADIGITGRDRFLALAPDRVLFQLRGAQDFEIDRVIQIVAVVGDFVGEIRDLRFQRRTSILFLAGPGGS